MTSPPPSSSARTSAVPAHSPLTPLPVPRLAQATPEQRNLVNYLRGKNGPKVRNGLLNGKRTDYFKGACACSPSSTAPAPRLDCHLPATARASAHALSARSLTLERSPTRDGRPCRQDGHQGPALGRLQEAEEGAAGRQRGGGGQAAALDHPAVRPSASPRPCALPPALGLPSKAKRRRALTCCSLPSSTPSYCSAFFLRVQRSPEGSPRTLQINPQQAFPVEGTDYYAWFYEGSQIWTMVGGVGMVRAPPPPRGARPPRMLTLLVRLLPPCARAPHLSRSSSCSPASCSRSGRTRSGSASGTCRWACSACSAPSSV